MSSTESIKRPLKIFIGIAAITLLIVGLMYFRIVALAALVAMLGGILLEPLIRWMRERCRLPHGVSVAVTALLLLCGIGGVVYGGYRLIAGQVTSLIERAPEIREKLVAKMDQFSERFAWLGLNGDDMNVGEHVQKAATGALKVVTIGVEGLAYLLVILMLALFIAANFRAYGRGFLTLFPVERRARISRLGRGSIQVVRRWFVGQIVVVSISASLTAVALLIIGMDYWLLVAAITLLLSFIPFVGAIIAGVIAGVLTLGTEPDKIGWVLLAYILIQQVESDVLLPVVMKDRVQLPEAHLMVFVLVLAAGLGVIGVFIAPPLFAVLHHLYCQAYIPWVERRPPAT